MEVRNKLENIHDKLNNTDYKSLFGKISPIYYLPPPIPLNTEEMHKISGEIIRNANKEVLLEFYKFIPESDGGKAIHSALKDLKVKAETQKIKINAYMLVNTRGVIAETVYKANTPITLEGLENSDYFNFTFTPHPTYAVGSLHQKMIVADAETAIIRGGDPDMMNNLEQRRIETAALISGPIASLMRQDYNDVWFAYCNENLPEMPPVDEAQSDDDLVPCIFLSKQGNGYPISYTHYYSQSPYKIALLQAISDAKTSIHIMTSNLNDSEILSSLAEACNRGISIKIITGKHHNDSRELLWGGTNFTSLANLTKKIEIECLKNLDIRWATNSDGDIVKDEGKYTLHAKYVCIDDELIFIGSSPLDKQAMYYSREADIVFQDEKTAKLFEKKLFNDNFNQGKNFFEEAYFRIRNTIELELMRLKKIAEPDTATDIQKNKYRNLNEVFITISTSEYPCFREKLFDLLESVLPICEIPTGNKPGKPASYNNICSLVEEYGLTDHIKIKPDTAEQFAKTETETNQFFTSVSRLKKRSLSNSGSSPMPHEGERSFLTKST